MEHSIMHLLPYLLCNCMLFIEIVAILTKNELVSAGVSKQGVTCRKRRLPSLFPTITFTTIAQNTVAWGLGAFPMCIIWFLSQCLQGNLCIFSKNKGRFAADFCKNLDRIHLSRNFGPLACTKFQLILSLSQLQL